MRPNKYMCRSCGKELTGFNCSCNESSNQKNIWDKAQRKAENSKVA